MVHCLFTLFFLHTFAHIFLLDKVLYPQDPASNFSETQAVRTVPLGRHATRCPIQTMAQFGIYTFKRQRMCVCVSNPVSKDTTLVLVLTYPTNLPTTVQ